MERPEVRDYFETIHGQMIRNWELPEGHDPDQRADLRLWIAASGELLMAEEVSSSTPEFGASALAALAASSPLPPVPEGAGCVTEHALRASFSNPEKAASRGSYLDRVAVRDEYRDTYLMHWPVRKMPLAVHLPRPPEGLFEDPEGVYEAVRTAVLAWTDVAKPGVPSFHFVDAHGDADIPIVWAEEPDGDWYIAFCSLQTRPRRNLFDVEHLLVTGRWGGGAVATTDQIHEVVLHEMGHALGLAGHSDHPGDIMYPSASIDGTRRLSERDRRTLRELYARGNRQVRGTRGRPD